MATFSTSKYRLRAGGPMPVSAGTGNFVLHSFMAVTNDVTIDTCTVSLLKSTSFQGQGGSFSGATYSQLPVKTGNYFKGTEVAKDVYVEEA